MAHLELYKQQIKKLYPNIGEEEFNKKIEDFEADMAKQAGRFRENELDGTYREIKEDWVKVAVRKGETGVVRKSSKSDSPVGTKDSPDLRGA
jgi:hypothetical protein